MSFSLIRIDDRIIHGQTMTSWTQERKVDGIIVVSDDAATNQLRQRVLKAAAGNIKLGIYSTEQAVVKIPMALESSKHFFLISDSPIVFSNLLNMGVNFGSELNVGPMNTKTNTKAIAKTVSISKDDYDAFENIQNHGIEIQFQLLPYDTIKTWDELKKKF